MLVLLAWRCRARVRGGVQAEGPLWAIHRLYAGAATRSVRCGGANVLYFSYRHLLASVSEDTDKSAATC